ncbi:MULTISPECIES: hypothetical protein [unclassified Micromonospora]|uniref:hypothetical protein n=1 Tax=unclassified Micromonospora TaxID=2617518 RepID=UPI003316B0DB
MSAPKIDDDSHGINRIPGDHAILTLLEKRQHYGHTVYGTIAGLLAGTAVFIWGFILRDAYDSPPQAPTRGYLAWLAFAVVIGIGGLISTFTWMTVRVIQRLAAERDRISRYDEKQFVKKVVTGVHEALKEDRRAEKVRRWQEAFAAEGTTGNPPAPPPSTVCGADRTQVIPITGRQRRDTRGSS